MIKSLFMTLLLVAFLTAQSTTDRISKSEINLANAEQQISKFISEQENIESTLKKRSVTADSLHKAGASQDKLADFTAQSFAISKQLEKINEQIEHLYLTKNQIRDELYKLYSVQIDSLEKLHSTTNREAQLFVLMGKRLQVSPLAARLRFNPTQLNSISNSVDDSLGILIFKQYLQNAEQELQKQILIISEKEQEITEIAALESKSEEFMMEMEESSMLQSSATSAASLAETETRENYGTLDGGEKSVNIIAANEQTLGFLQVINQLDNTIQVPDSKHPLSYQQLLDKLEEARKILQSYQTQVQQKLNTFVEDE